MLSKKTIKYIQSLSHKKFRDINGAFIAETPKVVDEFLRSPFEFETVFATEKWYLENEEKLKDLNDDQKVMVTESDLGRISQLKTPHDVLAVMKIPHTNIPEKISGQWAIMLDDVQDPGNVGTIIRIADWFGIKNIFCSLQTANVFSPKVVQATMGSLAHVKVFYCQLQPLIGQFGLDLFAASLEGESLYDCERQQEGILLIGNEANGISESLMDIATKKVTISRIGQAESLNAAVATGIILSHLVP